MGRLLGDRLSYRNHYMCSVEATSIIKSNIMSVSVFLFPNSFQTTKPDELQILRDDSPWDWEGFRLKNIWIRRTVRRKIACIVGMYTSDPRGQFSSLFLQRLCEVGRGWGD